jgi:SAM-dependent methyltransferase
MKARDPGAGHAAAFGYHATLVGDPHRIAAFDLALRRALTPGARVLDVGTGTGILAALAARYGAARVFAVESMPIADAADDVFRSNDLDGRVRLIRSDIRALEGLTVEAETPEVDAVDVIVSDCLGRFVVDDFMGDAMAAAMRWLKPGGTVIPASVTLFAAPVELHAFAPLDGWSAPVLGVDMGVVGAAAVHRALAISVGPEALLAPGKAVGTWRPGERLPTFETPDIPWVTARAGRLRGFVGWFEADLGHGVRLSTAPGIATHWHQILFPAEARVIDAGTSLQLRLSVELDGSPEPRWAWDIGVNRDPVRHYGCRSDAALTVADGTPSLPYATAEEASEAGAVFIERGDHGAALEAFDAALRLATTGGHGPPDATLLRRLREDVGVAATLAGRPERAVLPLLASLDGWIFGGERPAADDPHTEQALRLLVDACLHSGRAVDGQRFLNLYEGIFGPHPAGWTHGNATAPAHAATSPRVEESS